MANAQHSKQTVADGIHVVQALEYANAVARTGASGFTAEDVGKVARQTDDNTFWVLQTTAPLWGEMTSMAAAVATKDAFFTAQYNANRGDLRVRNVGASGTFRYTFRAPHDFTSIITLAAIVIPTAGAAGSARDIDMFSDYGAVDEGLSHSESDTSSIFDLTGKADQVTELDVSAVFSMLAAGDYCGVFIDHNGIGGALDYLGIRLRYS